MDTDILTIVICNMVFLICGYVMGTRSRVLQNKEYVPFKPIERIKQIIGQDEKAIVPDEEEG